MRRAPVLYQLYLGRYLRNDMPIQPGSQPDMKDFLELSAKKMELKEKVEIFIRENPQYEKSLADKDKPLSLTQLEDAEDELIVLMHHRFLHGLDKDYIDYGAIDFNE